MFTPLATVYCTDEDVASRAIGDYQVLAPRWQKLAVGTDGVFAVNQPWIMTSASSQFSTQGVVAGSVFCLSGPQPYYAGSGELFGVTSVSNSTGVVLKRIGPNSAGVPPAPPAGLTGVTFLCLTAYPQIESSSYDANDFFGLDPNLPSRAPSLVYDKRELLQFTVLTALVRLYSADNRSIKGDFAEKLKQYRTELGDLRSRLTIRWGNLGTAELPRSLFSARRIR